MLANCSSSQKCPISQWLVITGGKYLQRVMLTYHGNIILLWNPEWFLSSNKALNNLLILPIKWRREYVDSRPRTLLGNSYCCLEERRDESFQNHWASTETNQWGKQEDRVEFTVCSNKVMLFYGHSKSLVVEQNEHKHSSL